jgi:hypothetical protein
MRGSCRPVGRGRERDRQLAVEELAQQTMRGCNTELHCGLGCDQDTLLDSLCLWDHSAHSVTNEGDEPRIIITRRRARAVVRAFNVSQQRIMPCADLLTGARR